jgi:sulfate adenylyltransferase subunit 2
MKNYLQILEDEAIYIIRETASSFENPVVLYSIGKDSSVLLHLILKAFYPAPPPFKFLHVNTGWKFKEMIEFRDKQAKKFNLDLITYKNPRGDKENITPFTHTSSAYTGVMKTEALRYSLKHHNFDVAIGGARRDEEKSRAKERVFSFRNEFQGWDPKNQRPELFDIFNAKINRGESMRVFPLSNWTEMDVWEYIEEENIELVPLYFAKKRDFVIRGGVKIMVDDNRFPLSKDEKIQNDYIRFRTLGCYPLTGAIDSKANSISKIVKELKESKYSERQGRLIDGDQESSMERKKKEGYF